MNLTEIYSNIKNTTNAYNLTDVNIVQIPDKNLPLLKNTAEYNNRQNFNTNANGVLSQDKKGKNTTPSKYDVYKNSKFGKVSRDHSFTSEASFEQILIFLLKSNYLHDKDKNNVLETHYLFRHLNKMIDWSKNIDIMTLKEPIKNYANQEKINPERIKKILAASLTYDFSIPTLIRFLGGNYTGEYRNAEKTVKILEESKCDPQIIKEIKSLLTTGCPQKFNASSTRKNFLDFFRYGNHTSIKKNLEQTMKAINKEERNQYLIPLPNWVSRFIANMHLTPQGLLTKKGKNDRLIWDGSFTPNWNAICINMMLNQKTEPEIIYGQAFINHLQHLYNFRLSYPDDEIVLMDDDVKGAFRHCKYHPDIATAFAFIIQNLLFIPLGGTFGSVVSPANFEPIARARIHLAEYLSTRTDLLDKYKHIIDKVKFSDPPDPSIKYAKGIPDKFNTGVQCLKSTKYHMFVDDSLFVQTRDQMKHAMAASIEALHIILGYPDTDIRQNPLSLDKYYESTCSFERIQLGITINTRRMTLALTKK